MKKYMPLSAQCYSRWPLSSQTTYKGQTMHISPESGRNDSIHGDEHYYDYLIAIEDQTTDDVLEIIATNSTGAYDWIKLLADSDALYHLVVILSKGRNKPEYKELLEALKTEIKGFL